MRRTLILFLTFAAAATSAQVPTPFGQEEVLVIVWSGADRCSVLDRKTNCSRVATLMTEKFQLSRDSNIVVATNGKDTEVAIRVAQVMADIRAAGFRRVRQADTH